MVKQGEYHMPGGSGLGGGGHGWCWLLLLPVRVVVFYAWESGGASWWGRP